MFKDKKFQFINLFFLGVSIISVFLISFAPFIYFSIQTKSLEPLFQIFRRLFPFGRGLLHAYWAPNLWALYSFLDKIIFHISSVYIYPQGSVKSKNLSSLGLTQITEFNVLPNINTNISNFIVVTSSLLFVLKSLLRDNYHTVSRKRNNQFFKYIIISSLIFFNFGYQVHEKAFIKTSLMGIIYLIHFISCSDKIQENVGKDINNYNSMLNFLINLILSVGIFSQMPLIHSIKDYIIKLVIVLLYLIISRLIISYLLKIEKNRKISLLSIAITVFTLVCLILDFVIVLAPHLNLNMLQKWSFLDSKFISLVSSLSEKYQFLPLMLFSIINAAVVQLILFMIFYLKEE